MKKLMACLLLLFLFTASESHAEHMFFRGNHLVKSMRMYEKAMAGKNVASAKESFDVGWDGGSYEGYITGVFDANSYLYKIPDKFGQEQL